MNDLSGMDLDWFFTTKDGKIIHLASAGGDVPNEVDEHYLDEISDILGELDSNYDYVINPNLENILKANNRKIPKMKYYLETFVEMAKLGIFSFDKTDINNGNDNNYHLVASPKDKFLSVYEIQGLKESILSTNKDIQMSFNLDEIQFYK